MIQHFLLLIQFFAALPLVGDAPISYPARSVASTFAGMFLDTGQITLKLAQLTPLGVIPVPCARIVFVPDEDS